MENWKDIKGYEGWYQISNQGRVKSLPRFCNANKGYFKKEKILCQCICNVGYFKVRLMRDSIGHGFYIHRLVAQHFLDNPQGLLQVNHKNGCKTNNYVENLEWVSQQENLQHAYYNNLIRPQRKKILLTTEQEVEIRKLCQTYTQTEVAKMFGVVRSRIYYILQRT